MLETGKLPGGLGAGWIDHRYGFAGGTGAPGGGVGAGIRGQKHIFRGEEIACGRWRGGCGDDELVSGKAGTLIGLKHAVRESVRLGNLEVRLDVGGVHVLELRVGRRATDRAGLATDGDLVGAVHFSAVVHGDKSRVGMAEDIVVGEGDGRKRNGLSERVDTAVGNIGVGQTVKEIIGGAVLLKDDNNVLNLLSWRRRRRHAASTPAACESYEEGNCTDQGNQDARQEYFLLAQGVIASTPGVPFHAA